MRQIVPYEKEIKFKTKIAEISSISLEHELNSNDFEVNGEFIVSGDYKTHEISVNKESFSYKLPFSVTLTDSIELSSLDFEILDFRYDVVGDDILKVNIEFEVYAEEKKEIDKEKEEVREEIIIPFETEETTEEVKETIMDNIPTSEEKTYITYHVHIVRETDTLESICVKYGVDDSTIKSINKIEEINIGDKILVPEYGEE